MDRNEEGPSPGALARVGLMFTSFERPGVSSTEVECRRGDLLELCIGYGLILLAVWTPRPFQLLVNWMAFAWIMLATGFAFEDWSAMGLRISGSLRSLWVIALALVVAAVAIATAGRLHTLHMPGSLPRFVGRYGGYTIWAVLQQFILLDFVLLRLLRLLPSKRAAVAAAAGLFAFAHLPNPILTPVTMIWGVAACLLFLHYRNVYTLGVAHAIFGICIAVTIPGHLTHHMKVGLGYVAYHRPSHEQSRIDHASPLPIELTEHPISQRGSISRGQHD
jgi:hypothetical protein